ncbi:MAG: glutamate--tRNA ligase [Phycisphaerales bacterium]
MSTDQPPLTRTRFAPSPSGHLHVGGARTALYCWAFAKQHNGRFILRIEDTDQKRSSDAASLGFLEDLKWLGIEWDEGPDHNGCGGGEFGPYFQSQRLDIYNRYIDQLIESGHAYLAFDTAEELDAERDDARQRGGNYRYDRAGALAVDAATVARWVNEGKPHVVRFKTPAIDITTHDQVLGDVLTPAGELDDFVIRKADGYPTYHFAVVVDDELMQVTHILRGQEHLKNTARHIVLQDALGFRRPMYGHLSLIFNPDNSKMSKRDKDKTLRRAIREQSMTGPPEAANIAADRWVWWLSSDDHQLEFAEASALADAMSIALPEINVDDFRRSGYLPEVICNYLALLGWSPGNDVERFDRNWLIDNFSVDRLHKSPAKFDRDKLLAFNLDAIKAMSESAFCDALHAHAQRYHPAFLSHLGSERFKLFAAANQARSKTLDDCFRSDVFFVQADDAIAYQDIKPVRKALGGEPSGRDILRELQPHLAQLADWSAAGIEHVLHDFAEERAEGKLGKIAQPLRVAVTGGVVSPGINETLAILGKQSTLARIERCLREVPLPNSV